MKKVNGYDIKPCADLQGADLQEADLKWADLKWADLRGADLFGADLLGAYLQGADLRGAKFYGAVLRWVRFDGAVINWQSHDLVAELLSRHAGQDAAKRKLAGLVLFSRDWCWNDFLAVRDRNRSWALDVLAGYVRDGDDAPPLLQRRAIKLKQEETK